MVPIRETLATALLCCLWSNGLAQVDSNPIEDGTVDFSSHPITLGSTTDQCHQSEGCYSRMRDEQFLDSVRKESRTDEYFCSGHKVKVVFERLWQSTEMTTSSVSVMLDNEDLEIPSSLKPSFGDIGNRLPEINFFCEADQARVVFSPFSSDMQQDFGIHAVVFESKLIQEL